MRARPERFTALNRAAACVAALVIATGCGSSADKTSPSITQPTTSSVAQATTLATTPASQVSPTAPVTAPTTGKSPPPTTQPVETSAPTTTQPVETSAPPTTTATTVAVGPPAFDPDALGNNLTLPSFIHTVTVENTNNGQVSKNITTTGFINDPTSAYELATFSFGGSERRFLIDGRSYEETNTGDWYLDEAGSTTVADFARAFGGPSEALAGVSTALFTGQADFAGIPANHFVFNETDLVNYPSYTPDHPSPTVEGDMYLALDGNHVLYAHSKETSPNRTYEVTEELSYVGLLTEITLPADLAPMTQALDIGVALGGILPPGSSLLSMLRYSHGIGIDYYSYRTSVATNEEFLNFYRALPPTNGWTVSHIGHITPHLEPTNCETQFECVILNNGGDQIVVSFSRGITLEYDREHVFTPR